MGIVGKPVGNSIEKPVEESKPVKTKKARTPAQIAATQRLVERNRRLKELEQKEKASSAQPKEPTPAKTVEPRVVEKIIEKHVLSDSQIEDAILRVFKKHQPARATPKQPANKVKVEEKPVEETLKEEKKVDVSAKDAPKLEHTNKTIEKPEAPKVKEAVNKYAGWF